MYIKGKRADGPLDTRPIEWHDAWVGLHRSEGGNVDGKDVAGVREVLQRYTDATYRADVESLRDLFHPAALMTGYLGDDVIVGDPSPFLTDLRDHPSMADTNVSYKADIADVHLAGRVASARVEESGFFGATSFVNYFHLLEVEGEWRIVSKTFQSF